MFLQPHSLLSYILPQENYTWTTNKKLSVMTKFHAELKHQHAWHSWTTTTTRLYPWRINGINRRSTNSIDIWTKHLNKIFPRPSQHLITFQLNVWGNLCRTCCHAVWVSSLCLSHNPYSASVFAQMDITESDTDRTKCRPPDMLISAGHEYDRRDVIEN